MTHKIKTWSSNVDVRIEFEDDKDTSVVFNIFNIDRDSYSCQCDVEATREYLDIDTLQQWWNDENGECKPLEITTKHKEYIIEAIMDGITSKTNYMNLTDTCENCK